MTSLNKLAAEVHSANATWWRDPATGQPIERDKGELLALVHSELSEALEGERKNLMDDKLPDRKMAEVEMADAVIRLLDFAGGFNLNLNDWSSPFKDLNDPAIFGDRPQYEFGTNKGHDIALLHSTVTTIWWCLASQENRLPIEVTHAIFAIAGYCRHYGYDLQGAVTAKLAYNRTREDHRPENRLKPGGKTF